MGRKSRRFLKNIERQFRFYTSEYFLERLWIDIRIKIEDYIFPLPPQGEKEETRKYVARISPDQAVRYTGYLVKVWSEYAKFFNRIDDNRIPKKSWPKMHKRS